MKKKTRVLKGIGVSPGISIGKAYLVESAEVVFTKYTIPKEKVDDEISRFLEAVSISRQQLQKVKAKLSKEIGKEHVYILDAHLLILEDKMLIDGTTDIIKGKNVNAEEALKVVLSKFAKIFRAIDDDYLRERNSDVDDVGSRILRNLAGYEHKSLSDLEEEVIAVAHDLAPSDTAQMHKDSIKAFVTDIGGRTSHTAIMARALEIPAVVGLENVTERVKTGDRLIVDGNSGIVVVDPNPTVFKEYLEKQRRYKYFEHELVKLKDLTAETLDGYRIQLSANIELPSEVPSIVEHGAEGIGLYRTEFLFLNRTTLPSEKGHFKVYKNLVEKIAPHSAIIRTLDLGGDKFASHINLAKEMNPAMGLRAIRFCLHQVGIFKTQLKAILRASAFGKLKIMYPMISGVEELRQANEILAEVRYELDQEGITYDHNIEVGVMIETPSAAIIADLLAREVDFFSIGTNDLIQYSLAIDRVNEHVAYLYEPLHPAVLRTIKNVVDVGHNHGIQVGMCGEMAGDPMYALILLGFGLDELSMNAVAIPRVKKIIRNITLNEVEKLAGQTLDFTTAKEIEKFVKAEMLKKFPEDVTIDGKQMCLL